MATSYNSRTDAYPQFGVIRWYLGAEITIRDVGEILEREKISMVMGYELREAGQRCKSMKSTLRCTFSWGVAPSILIQHTQVPQLSLPFAIRIIEPLASTDSPQPFRLRLSIQITTCGVGLRLVFSQVPLQSLSLSLRILKKRYDWCLLGCVHVRRADKALDEGRSG